MASAAAAAQRRARPMQLKREEKMKRGRAIEPIEHTHTHNNMPRALCVRVHLPPSIYVWPSPGMCGHFVPWSARSAAIGRPYKACIPEQ
jgi:hypothetical protein